MTQAQAIEIMLSGRNVFLTGAPGAGKTYTLDQLISKLWDGPKHVAVTASTGIAASHINGHTIHSWSGLGIKDRLTDVDLKEYEGGAKYSRVRKRYRKTDVLIIDEVSMLSGNLLDMVNRLAKKIRNNDQPFGGMQVILVGDLFQLPPITRGTTEIDFVHLSRSWNELQLQICYITEQHRQAGDDPLLDVLLAMRVGDIQPRHRETIALRLKAAPPDDNVTKLFTHNVDVDVINQKHLAALPGKVKRFKMSFKGDSRKTESMVRNILAPENLELKVGAEVMFVANNFNEGFVNGTRGKVIKFNKSGDPLVEVAGGRTIIVEVHDWRQEEEGIEVARVSQVPLRLAWAITVHKSQGMSLDAALIDLSKAFTTGMGYVALSRVRSVDGLYITGINDTALKMHAEIYEFDAQLQALSAGAK